MGCFQDVAVTDKATVNIMWMSLYEDMLSFLFGKYLGLEWLDHLGGVYLTF